MSTQLSEIEHAYEPPEELLDEYHPANAPYFQQKRRIEQRLVTLSQKMKSKHVQAAKMRHTGRSNIEIADALGYAEASVSAVFARPRVRELMGLLQHLQLLKDGPNIESRKRFLWEIAVDNKDEDPKTAISAVQEMNRMDGVGKDTGDRKIEVIINNELLPRGPLDQ